MLFIWICQKVSSKKHNLKHKKTSHSFKDAGFIFIKHNLFNNLLCVQVITDESYLARKIMRPFDKSYGVNSTVTLSPVKIRI